MNYPTKLPYLRAVMILLAWLILLAGCTPEQAPVVASNPSPAATAVPTRPNTPTLAPTQPPTSTATGTNTPEPTETPLPSATATQTQTPTPAETATPTLTVTPEVLTLAVQMRAFCRYGPGKAYLYSAELKEGDVVQVDGRNYNGSWLWVQPANLPRHCWTSASVGQPSGDVLQTNVVQTKLPFATNLYDPPDNIQASRSGGIVIVTWDPVWMTEDDDRGYLIEANVCQNGELIPIAVHVDTPYAEVPDDLSCSGDRGGKLYTVEKHGYTEWVGIPWP